MVIADKAGDVHCYPVSPESEVQSVSSCLLLGHVSMLLDVVGTCLSCNTLPCLTSQFPSATLSSGTLVSLTVNCLYHQHSYD